MKKLIQELANIGCRVLENESLAPYTTIGTGGPARLLVVIPNSRLLERAIHTAADCDVACKVVGRGSNIIVSDKGYNGLVLINQAADWEIMGPVERPVRGTLSVPRLQEQKRGPIIDEEDSRLPDIVVRADSGLRISSLMNGLFRQGISGLQWFAGIPATVGGAIYMNMHGGHYFFGDLVCRAALTDGRETKIVKHDYFRFDYDFSILHQTAEIILWAELYLKKGRVSEARKISKSWAASKAHQPQRSAGCIFHNLTGEQQRRLGLPTPSVGYYIDRVLGLKGYRIGGAMISPNHAAFIENSGQASSTDIYRLIELVRQVSVKETGLTLETEVEFIGEF